MSATEDGLKKLNERGTVYGALDERVVTTGLPNVPKNSGPDWPEGRPTTLQEVIDNIVQGWRNKYRSVLK